MARPGFTTHPKFRRLVHLLGMPEPHVLGHLEYLWAAAYENGEPIIGDAVDVELAAKWTGEPGTLVDALAACGGTGRCGLIEISAKGDAQWQIHDLFDHAPDYVMKRAEREATRKLRGQTISDVRREAANARWRKVGSQDASHAADAMQTDASDARLHASGCNGDTKVVSPAPAPAPAPAPEEKSAAHPSHAEDTTSQNPTILKPGGRKRGGRKASDAGAEVEPLPPIPPTLDAPIFRDALDRFIAHRAKSDNPFDAGAARYHFPRLVKLGYTPEAAADLIDLAISRKKWAGFVFNDTPPCAAPAARHRVREFAGSHAGRPALEGPVFHE